MLRETTVSLLPGVKGISGSRVVIRDLDGSSARKRYINEASGIGRKRLGASRGACRRGRNVREYSLHRRIQGSRRRVKRIHRHNDILRGCGDCVI